MYMYSENLHKLPVVDPLNEHKKKTVFLFV